MPSASKRRKSSNKRKQITTISHSPPTTQSQEEERENCVESRVVQVEKEKVEDSSNHKQMDESENHKIEEPQKAEFKSDNVIIVIESVNVENFENKEETHEEEGGEFSVDQTTMITHVVDLEEFNDDNKVVLDSHIVESSESTVDLIKPSLSEVENSGASGGFFEFKAKETEEERIIVVSDDEKNVAEVIDESNELVSSAVMDLVSKEIDSSFSVENGIQRSVSKGIETCLDEKKEVSSVSVSNKGIEETLLPPSDETVALDLPPIVEASNGGQNSSMTQLPESTENQRTSWMGCCGLFEVLRRSNY